MARGRKSEGQPRKRTRRGSGQVRWLVPLVVVLIAVPALALAAVSYSQGKLPGLSLPGVGPNILSRSTPTAVAARGPASPVSTPRSIAPTSVPTRPEATVVPARTPTAVTNPAARPSVAPVSTVAPTSTPAAKMLLKVPIYRQEHTLSCEAASLRMALATFGLQLSEDKLLASLARDPTPRKVVGDSVQWGDPDVGFVGSWNGVYLEDGYGVYQGPIADLAMSEGFETVQSGKNGNPRQWYASVRAGYPSIVWMPYDLTVKGRGSWTTPAGKMVPYVVTEHAVVLAGVDGEGVYYADPMKPVLQYASFSAFEKAAAELDGRYVTVRP